MGERDFVDYYELLQLSPNADDETIHRVFRHLAKRLHPDTPGGNAERFNQLVEAHKVLTDPEMRAAYDVRHQRHWELRWAVAGEAADPAAHLDDEGIRSRLLSLFYTQRRSNMRNPGLGSAELAKLAGCPHELIEFHLWYLREKGWIERLETGLFAITAQGVDAVEARRSRSETRLIETRPIRTAAS
ncbi:MAG TPA: J domain-containing protein [Candidatus Limnocylindria bacterium]|nr:J domain-containing protein [Candidatus Limnocylindria bacterium]